MKHITKLNLFTLVGFLIILVGVAFYVINQRSGADTTKGSLGVTLYGHGEELVLTGTLTDYIVRKGGTEVNHGTITDKDLITGSKQIAHITVDKLAPGLDYEVELTKINPDIALSNGDPVQNSNPRKDVKVSTGRDTLVQFDVVVNHNANMRVSARLTNGTFSQDWIARYEITFNGSRYRSGDLRDNCTNSFCKNSYPDFEAGRTYKTKLYDLNPNYEVDPTVSGNSNPRDLRISSDKVGEVEFALRLKSPDGGHIKLTIKPDSQTTLSGPVGKYSIVPDPSNTSVPVRFDGKLDGSNPSVTVARTYPTNDYGVSFYDIDPKYKIVDSDAKTDSYNKNGYVARTVNPQDGQTSEVVITLRENPPPSPAASSPAQSSPAAQTSSQASQDKKVADSKSKKAAKTSPTSASPSPTPAPAPGELWAAGFTEQTVCNTKSKPCTGIQKTLADFLMKQKATCLNLSKENCSRFEQFLAKLFNVKKYPLSRTSELTFTTIPQNPTGVTGTATIGVCLQAKKGSKPTVYRFDLSAKAAIPTSLADFLKTFTPTTVNTKVIIPTSLTKCMTVPT